MFHIQPRKNSDQLTNKSIEYIVKMKKDSLVLGPAKGQGSFYIMLPHVIILLKTIDSGGDLDTTVGGGYMAEPPLSLWPYNSKKQGFS